MGPSSSKRSHLRPRPQHLSPGSRQPKFPVSMRPTKSRPRRNQIRSHPKKTSFPHTSLSKQKHYNPTKDATKITLMGKETSLSRKGQARHRVHVNQPALVSNTSEDSGTGSVSVGTLMAVRESHLAASAMRATSVGARTVCTGTGWKLRKRKPKLRKRKPNGKEKCWKHAAKPKKNGGKVPQRSQKR